MNIEELSNFLEVNQNIYWRWEEEGGKKFIYLYSKVWRETIKIDMNKINNISIEEIKMALTGGKNVEQITRVTGFFSVVRNWNAGKHAELKDRYRNKSIMEEGKDIKK